MEQLRKSKCLEAFPQLTATGFFGGGRGEREERKERRETRPKVVLGAQRPVAPSSWVVPNLQSFWQSFQAAFPAPHEELQDDAGLRAEPAEHPLAAWNRKEAEG